MNDSWQFSELKQFLNKHTHDHLIDTESVYLSNPKHRQKIDNIIANNIWPSIKKGVLDSPIRAILTKDDEDIYYNLEEK